MWLKKIETALQQCLTLSDTVPLITENSTDNEPNYTAPYFPLLGFQEYEGNPIMALNPANDWESAYLYNPSAIVVDDTIWILNRAQNSSRTSSIGLGWSKDGPRVIRVNGTFYLTYTGYDLHTARLYLATSTDLVSWTKYGPMLPNVTDVVCNWQDPLSSWVPRQGWSKSGAILNTRQPDGTYHMHFGDSFLYFANSTDLIHWNSTYGSLVFAPKGGMWLKFYNGVATGLGGFVPTQYSTRQMLIDPVNQPYGPPIARLESPILQPTSVNEVEGQVDNVVFSEGLVQFRGRWFLYFGQGDAFYGVATAPVQS
ncbi:Arabinanase/levansucrase/invertase [Acephala macrosclerotiorum]|nr:Arabinanase/levansucrase/invertase [Acephala macrosclerotiorum]